MKRIIDTFYQYGSNLATVMQLMRREPDVFNTAPQQEESEYYLRSLLFKRDGAVEGFSGWWGGIEVREHPVGGCA